jgi:SAM-dependent methyltransferase
LAEHFDEVKATDASDSQIKHAIPHAKVRYLVAAAESNPFIADNSIELITVASAIHWFNFDNFFSEAQRVLAKDGLIAAWVFHSTDGNSEFDSLIRNFQHDTVGAYFPEETRQWIWTDYKSIPFPFQEIAAPEFLLPIEWTASDTLGYLSTWSSVQRYTADRGENPLTLIEDDLARILENEGGVIRRNWKLCLRVGRKK